MKFYWPSELYSFGKYYRKYGRYPRFLPLLFYSDHSGPCFDGPIDNHEIYNDANLFFTFSEKRKVEFQKLTNKKAYLVMSPQIFYRRKYNIKKKENAVGTIAFPDHVLPKQDYSYNIDTYCKQLLNLPTKFHPITVCLHMHDINVGTDLIYKKYGFEVVSAGNTSHKDFIKNLYHILKNKNYVTSNMVGTISLLAIEMNHNFFVYPQIELNLEDSFPLIKYRKNNYLYNYIKTRTLDRVDEEIELNMYHEIEKAFGIGIGISRNKFTWLIWKQFFIELFTLEFFVKLRKKVISTYKNNFS